MIHQIFAEDKHGVSDTRFLNDHEFRLYCIARQISRTSYWTVSRELEHYIVECCEKRIDTRMRRKTAKLKEQCSQVLTVVLRVFWRNAPNFLERGQAKHVIESMRTALSKGDEADLLNSARYAFKCGERMGKIDSTAAVPDFAAYGFEVDESGDFSKFCDVVTNRKTA